MQIQVDIGFGQLVKIAKKLPKTQLQRLKIEVEAHETNENKRSDLEAFLLKGPTLTQDQLDIIEGNRKAIIKWRTK